MTEPTQTGAQEPSGVRGLLKGLATALGVLAGLFLASCGVVYLALGPKNLSASEAAQFVTLQKGDTLLHARSGVRWLDSQRYFVIQATAESYEKYYPESGRLASGTGAAQGWKVQTWSGLGKDAPIPSEKLPGWWDVAELRHVDVVDAYREGAHAGEIYIFSPSNKRIYIVDR